MQQDEYNLIAEGIFKRIQELFPNLNMTIDNNHEQVDLSMVIKKQQGLDFDIHLNLQTDELWISTEYVSGSFFPMDNPEVPQVFEEIVIGLIKGTYRIVQFTNKNNFIYKSYIQKPIGGDWVNVFSRRTLFIPPWSTLQEKVITNHFSA